LGKAPRKRLTVIRIALGNIMYRKNRFLFLAGVIAVLSFALIGASLWCAGLSGGVENLSLRLGADALLVPSGYEHTAEGALLRGESGSFFFDAEIADRLMQADGISIDMASPQLFIASFDSPHCSAEVQLIGYVPETDFVVSPWLSKTLPDGPADGEIVAGASIVGKKGDVLRFFSRDYRIAAKLEKTGTGYDTSVFVNMNAAQTALEDYRALGGEVPVSGKAVSSVIVKLKDGADQNAFARNIRDTFRNYGVGVVLTQSMLRSISGNLKVLVGGISILSVLLWLTCALTLTMMFLAILNERGREFGIYRALGAVRQKLSAIVLAEALLTGAAGSVTGGGLICLLYFSFIPLIKSSTDMPYLPPNGVMTALWIGGGFLTALLTVGFASLWAVYKSASIAAETVGTGGD